MRQFLLKKTKQKQRKCIITSYFSSSFGWNLTECKNSNNLSAKSHFVCVNLVDLRKLNEKLRCFLGKFTQLAQILRDRRS